MKTKREGDEGAKGEKGRAKEIGKIFCMSSEKVMCACKGGQVARRFNMGSMVQFF